MNITVLYFEIIQINDLLNYDIVLYDYELYTKIADNVIIIFINRLFRFATIAGENIYGESAAANKVLETTTLSVFLLIFCFCYESSKVRRIGDFVVFFCHRIPLPRRNRGRIRV